MTDIILDNIYLTLLLPLWVFLIIMLGRFFSVYVNKGIIYVLTLLSSAFGAILSGVALLNINPDTILESEFHFLKINDFIINCGLHIDRTALIFAFTLFVVSFFVQLFAISYMKCEKKNYRFFALLNLFNFSMAGLFFSPNLFQLYVFWELAGIASYLLIGFEYFRQEKSIASKKVFLINRIGDTVLIGGTILCSYFIYAYAPNKTLATLSFVDMNTISTLVYAYTSTPLFWGICALFIIAAAVKSAQFPFYTWLQDAMEAKLPVSALLHSATLVASGLFLTLRMLPFYSLEETLLKIIAGLGFLTAVICSICAIAQTYPKKVLAYSTSAQLGLMFYALGLLNIKAALLFFVMHAFVKSTLFITLPEPEKVWNYTKFVSFLLAGLFLILAEGIPSGRVFTMVSVLSAFYILKTALLLYRKNGVENSHPPITEYLSILGLFIFAGGFYKLYGGSPKEALFLALVVSAITYFLYLKDSFFRIPIIYPLAFNGLYLDKFYTGFCAAIYEKFTNFCSKIDKNIFSNYKPIIYLSKAGVQITTFIEKYIMNGSVQAITNGAKQLSLIDLKAQNGNIQRYNAYAFIIITIILICLILAYSVILSFVGG